MEKNKDNGNRIIQGLWIGNELSMMERLSIKSFLDNGHEYHLYTYGDVKNIPVNTIVRDGNEILSEEKIFTYKEGWGKGSYAGFSDLFRVHLLHQRGGWWADTDVICLRPFDCTEKYVLASSFEGKWGELANNCVMKLPSCSYIGEYLLGKMGTLNTDTVKFGETGPHLLQKAVGDLSLQSYVAPSDFFCPISWRAVESKIVYPSEGRKNRFLINPKDLLRPIFRPNSRTGRITKKSYALHLWNEIWRNSDINKDHTYSKRCLYEKLKHRYFD